MTTPTPSYATQSLEQTLQTASISGAITAIGTVLYYAAQTLGSTALTAGIFLILMISLATFTFAMIDLVLDQPDAFSSWLSNASWIQYGAQTAVCLVLVGVLVFVADYRMMVTSTNTLATSVVYLTMIGVAVWFAQESVPSQW